MTTGTSTLRKKRSKAKKTTKKVSSKKTVAKKKTAARKKPAARKKTPKGAARKKTVKKKLAKKSTAKKTTSKKTTSRKKTASRRSRANVMSGPGIASAYKSRRGERYMSAKQLEHFRQKLLAWKSEIIEDLGTTMNHLKDESVHLADPNDRATQESEFALELRTRDRERKLLKKIAEALARIDDGSYGYCEETGEEIGIARLEIRPVATLCVEAQERRERSERQYVGR